MTDPTPPAAMSDERLAKLRDWARAGLLSCEAQELFAEIDRLRAAPQAPGVATVAPPCPRTDRECLFPECGCNAPTPPAEAALADAVARERERCAGIVDAECARVLSLQTGKEYPHPDHAVDHNLRMIAVLLPDIAAAIREQQP